MPDFSYCPKCGSPLSSQERGGRPRPVCPACGYVHYRNPVVGVAVVLSDAGRILMGRRSRGAYGGMWCIPCGYVEWGEDIRETAHREFLEETGLEVEVGVGLRGPLQLPRPRVSDRGHLVLGYTHRQQARGWGRPGPGGLLPFAGAPGLSHRPPRAGAAQAGVKGIANRALVT